MSRIFPAFAVLSMILSTPVLNADISDPNRFVQIESIDFTSNVLQLTNFDSTSKDLSGWRFCTHDEDQIRRYSASTGLNGVTLAAGASLFVHFNNDGSGANEINVSTIGGNFAEPFDVGPDPGGAYAVGLYVNSGFGDGANLADHLQWSFNGADNTTADERSDEAQGEVWFSENDWISADLNTERIQLNVADFNEEVHSSANYLVSVPEPTSMAVCAVFGLGMLVRRRR